MPMPDQNRAAFRERLGMFALGVAIGFVILGLIVAMRQRSAQTAPPPAPASTR